MLNGKAELSHRARYLAVQGNPYQMGRMHGEAYRVEIQSFLADQLARVNMLRPTPLAPPELEQQLQSYRRAVHENLPEVAREIEGLADGAQISLAYAYLLQFRRELIGYRKVPRLGDCSTIACRVGNPYVAQTIDLNGGMAPLATVLRSEKTERGVPSALMLTFKGLLGYLGMNDAGLCVGINVVLAGDWGAGVSPYLMVRQMLRCRSVTECLALIRALPAASSRSFTILDRERLAVVEFGGGMVRVQQTALSTHTNHFLDPELAGLDEINVLSRNSSRSRLARLDRYAASQSSRDGENLFELLASHDGHPEGLCVHNEGDMRLDETVAAVIMRPSERRMLVRFGHPCRATTQEFWL